MSTKRDGSSRSGVIAGGNFIVDTVMEIDAFPREDMLANILGEARCNGGGPYNVLKDLAKMRTGFPLEAICLVGDDENGRWIRQDCIEHGIDVKQVHTTADDVTSYTQVMSARRSGRRTFFHRRGANRLLDVRHFDFRQTRAKLFHLGYLMLLDSLDVRDAQRRTKASRVLEAARSAGLETAADTVSVEHDDFRPTILATLPWIDHFVINEVEAGRILERTIPATDVVAVESAAAELLAAGVRRSVVVHTENGAVAVTPEGSFARGSLELPRGYHRGANGAGDAFAAGYLYAVHENWPVPERLRLAIGTAAACLSDPTPSAGLRPVAECLALTEQYPSRPWPVTTFHR